MVSLNAGCSGAVLLLMGFLWGLCAQAQQGSARSSSAGLQLAEALQGDAVPDQESAVRHGEQPYLMQQAMAITAHFHRDEAPVVGKPERQKAAS